MSKQSDKFEQLIKHIHDLLDQDGSIITWNDHLPDPDNPSQPRQIDITIKRENKITIVECRIHKSKQNVKWVEELIGRRISLQADAMIAVSASGFTKGAIAKAKKFGIILRDLVTLSKEEISSWGHLTKVRLIFYHFTNVDILFRFHPNDLNNINSEHINLYLQTSSNELYNLIEMISNTIVKDNHNNDSGKFTSTFKNKNLKIGEYPVASIDISLEFSVSKQELKIPSVVAYDIPKTTTITRETFIEQGELDEFKIIQSSNNVLVILDLSSVNIPKNYKLDSVDFEFSRTVRIEGWNIVGLPEMQIPLEEISIMIAPASDN